MKHTRGAVIIALLLGLLATARPSAGQSGGFTISNADASTDLAITGSAPLIALIGSVAPHFTIAYANTIRNYGITPPGGTLPSLLGQVADRFTLQYANASRVYGVTYPVALIGDSLPPVVSGLGVTPAGAGTVTIVWTTNEFSTATLEYGLAPGQYTQTLTNPLFLKLHEFTLSGLVTSSRYYYRFSNTDRSGNSVQSAEFSFTAQVNLFIPMVLR